MNVLRESRSFARLLCALCLSFALVLSGVGSSAVKGKFCAFECQKAYAVIPAVVPAIGIGLAACGISLTGIMAAKGLTADDVADAFAAAGTNIKDFVNMIASGAFTFAESNVAMFESAIDFANDLMGGELFSDATAVFDDSFLNAFHITDTANLASRMYQKYSAIEYVEREYANTWDVNTYPFSWDDYFAFMITGANSNYQIVIVPASATAAIGFSENSNYQYVELPPYSYYCLGGYSSYLSSQKWLPLSNYSLRVSDSRTFYWYGTVPASFGSVVAGGIDDAAVIPNSPVNPKDYRTAGALAGAAAAAALASGAAVTQTDLDNASKAIENGADPDISNLGQTAGTGEYTGILGQILNGILSIPRTIINTGADVISGIGEAVTSGVGTLVDTLADVIAKPIEAIKARFAPDEAVAIPSVWENFNQYLIFPLTIPADVLLLFDLIKHDGSAPKVTIKIAAPEWLNSKSFSAPAAGLSVVTHSGSNTADITIDMQAYALLATFLRFALSMLWVFGLVNLVMRFVKVEENAVVGGSM